MITTGLGAYTAVPIAQVTRSAFFTWAFDEEQGLPKQWNSLVGFP